MQGIMATESICNDLLLWDHRLENYPPELTVVIMAEVGQVELPV